MEVLHIGCGFRPWHLGGLLEYAEALMDTQVAEVINSYVDREQNL